MFIEQDIQNKELLEKFGRFRHDFDINKTDDLIYCCNIWHEFLEYYFRTLREKHPEFINKFSKEFIYKVFTYSDKIIDSFLLSFLTKKFVYISLIKAIKISPFQWYDNDNMLSNDLTLNIFNRLLNLTTPFNDERFFVEPIHAECLRGGINRSEWLNNKTGEYLSYFNEKDEKIEYKAESAYGTTFIDAKFGIIIFFKNKPSIKVSFNIDNDKNIYIHQIQATKKDRGHYKIKGNWRIEVIKYIKSIFNDFNINIISVDDLVFICKTSYRKEEFFTAEDNIYKAHSNLTPFFCKIIRKKSKERELNYFKLKGF